jgi:hypothetical protein
MNKRRKWMLIGCCSATPAITSSLGRGTVFTIVDCETWQDSVIQRLKSEGKDNHHAIYERKCGHMEE